MIGHDARLNMESWVFVAVLGLSLAVVQFSHSVVSDSLRPHELQYVRPTCPSPIPGVHPNPCPLSQWCHPTISSSVVPFSSYPQSFPALGSFPMSQLFESGGQSIGISASTSVLPMNTRDLSPLGWTGWTSLQSEGCGEWGLLSTCGAQASHCSGFSCCEPGALEHRPSSCGTWA